MNLRNLTFYQSSDRKQQGKSQSGGNKKTKHVTYVCGSMGKKCSFFGKFSVFYFLVTSVLKFAHVPYYQRNGSVTRLHSVNINSGYFSKSHNFLCLVHSLLLLWNPFKYTISYRSGVSFFPINKNERDDVISVLQHVLISKKLCFLFFPY